ncbi:MAG: ROK family protein, partial [Prevotella sp.]|nr:ROK family protein [Prevotella sp.]
MNKTAIKTRVVGVEINLDLTLYAIVDIRGDIIAEAELVTSDYPDVNQYVTALCDGIMNLIVAHDCFENIRSVGISAPSGNFQTGCMENSPNMPWKGVIPLAAMMRDRLGMAVSLSNNAHVVALAEHAFGSAHGMNDFVVLTLGHGVGSCFFSNGRAHLGVDGTGGEVGHTCLIPGGRQCGCGHHGCLEAYCSAKGIIRTARELLEKS